LWQGRFGSVVMDECHLFNAVRYISLNPVRAKLVPQAREWQWSSVAAHLSGKDDNLVKVVPPFLIAMGISSPFLVTPLTTNQNSSAFGNQK
jgi:putative transposase